jgi:hypothetical protein
MMCATVACLLWAQPVFAQAVRAGDKYEWFVSRLPIWALYGFTLGVLATWGWLRRIKYQPEELSIDAKVRKAFLYSLLAGVVLFVVSLWFDLWLVHSFPRVSLGSLEALSEAMRGWYWLQLVGLAAASFFVACYLMTRGAFSGRYALQPKRQGR